MRKIYLSVMWMFAGLLAAFSQSPKDSSAYKPRKLSFDEANLVSSYYQQDGNHASVTGGAGSEKLTDFANIIDVKFYKYDTKKRKHLYTLEAGIDNYSSASSDKVDLKANSSASSSDMRIYPSASWTVENDKKGTSAGAGISFSTEYDYKSFGANINLAKKTKDRNGELALKLQAYMDAVKLIYPVELRSGGGDDLDYVHTSEARNSLSASLSYAQVINRRLQAMVIADIVKQDGYLGLPFHRVYFNDHTVHVEKLPSSRIKFPLGARASYYLNDLIILKAFYRYYMDDWKLTSHTVNLEVPLKLNPFFSLTPFYRYYQQSGIAYFAPIEMHDAADSYYSSNYDLSPFSSNFFGTGIRYMPLNGIFGIKYFNMIEMRYGFYSRTNGLQSNIVSLNLKFK